MLDAKVWEFEESLWTGTAEHYKELVDAECLMVLPEPPYVLAGEQAIAAVSDTPRWARVVTTHRQIKRPQEGLIVVGYKVEAFKAEEMNQGQGQGQGQEKAYEAYCTSTYRRLEHEVWRVVQHQQTPSMHKAALIG